MEFTQALRRPFRTVRAVALTIAIGGAPLAAEAGPISVLYLTTSSQIAAVQGGSLVYSQPILVPFEWAIAVGDTVRTASYWPTYPGAEIAGNEYALGLGAPTGTMSVPTVVNVSDGATDGQYNYGAAYNTVYRFGTDWSGGEALFSIGGSYDPNNWVGITYDPFTSSLWVLQWQDVTGSGTTVAQFSLSGALLSSFTTGLTQTRGLAMDYADGTLWLSNEQMWFQFGTDGTWLGSQAYPGDRGLPLYGPAIYGAEFAFTPPQVVPEPGTLALLAMGLACLGVGRHRCRSGHAERREVHSRRAPRAWPATSMLPTAADWR